jgi:fucose 4-O-acetylase-like acetyltransferase
MTDKPASSRATRIAYIDAAKTICIFLMVVGHWTDNKLLITYIYSFHMPALFVVSGILYKPHPWTKTIIAFSVPLVCFSLLNLAVQIILKEVSLYSISFPKIFFQIFHYRYGLGESLMIGDWFLWALVFIRFIFGDITGLNWLRKYYILIAVIAIIYMSFENYLISIDTIFRGYLFGRAIPSLPFFCVGIIIKEKGWNPQKQPLPVIVLSLIAFMIVPLVNQATGIIDNGYGYSYIIFFMCAIFSTLLIFWLSDKIPSSRFTETISKGTLVVLGTHIPLLTILRHMLSNEFEFLFPIITIITCYYIIIGCERYCPILLGKIKSQPKISQ